MSELHMDSDLRSSVKNLRKILRKQKRCEIILEKNENIRCSRNPTRFIFVGNCGLVCEVGYEELMATFQSFGKIEDIIMQPHKSYSFVVFNKTEEAEVAMKHIHGMKLEHLKEPLYLSYAEQVPSVENLFAKDLPPGLIILENFVTEEEEDKLLSSINWSNSDKEELKHRRVKHFGYEFNYKTNNVDRNSPLKEQIPKACIHCLSKLVKYNHISRMPDQLTVNRYMPGQGIPFHIDTHSAFEDEIISISLGSQIVMEFRHPDGNRVPVLLPQRSIVIMTGESRYLWSHGIIPKNIDVIPTKFSGCGHLMLSYRNVRTSFTFRRTCSKPCTCDYPEQCDSQALRNRNIETINDGGLAKKLEEMHVLQVYNKIAAHFSKTRHKEWPKVSDFLETLPFGSLLIDVGCGNGKYLGKHTLVELGCDFSENLAKICKEKGLEVFVADNLRLPLRSEIADACISIAVLHHICTEERRITALKELVRVLRPKGKALIYVWAMEQKGPEGISNYVNTSKAKLCFPDKADEYSSSQKIASKTGIELPVHVNRTEFQQQDIFVPWHKDKNDIAVNEKGVDIYHRYYHVFIKDELEKLLETINGITVTQSYYDQGNWCVIIEKL